MIIYEMDDNSIEDLTDEEFLDEYSHHLAYIFPNVKPLDITSSSSECERQNDELH